ncbi:MAG: ATP cone domain-containing protein [Planctomycetota bacterium]
MNDTTAPPLVVKVNGETEPFDEEKLRISLARTGASPGTIDKVVEKLRRELPPRITTRRLYKRAFAFLKRGHRSAAARYSLSRAVRNMGPHGYAFERLVGALFGAEGWEADYDRTLPGMHVTHEVDVIARGPKTLFMECKHRLRHGAKCDVKVALYVAARAADLRAAVDAKRSDARPFDEFWLVTSGEFTLDAIAYAEGVGLKLLGWNHPEDNGLRLRIERAKLHPLTCLTSLDKRHKQALIEKKVVLCRELLEEPTLLTDVGVRNSRRVLAEIRSLLEGH